MKKKPLYAHRLREALLAALAIIALDQWSKWWMLARMGMDVRPPIELTPWLRIVLWWNHGISFGIFGHGQAMQAYQPLCLIALAIVICAILVRLAMASPIPLERAAYGLIIGGALGNVVDRLRFGAVADFIYLHLGQWGWPAFNLADSAICVGVLLLLVLMRKHPAQP